MNTSNQAEETLRLTKEALAKNITVGTVSTGEVIGGSTPLAIGSGTGLTAYDLQAPAKNLYPIITPLRNRIPRVGRTNPGDAARWRTIFNINGSGFDSMGWIPEGQRSSSMSYQAQSVVAPYLTLGEEDTITFEAEAAAGGFEDINATATLRLLQKTMRKEELALLGGNASLQLGTPAAPVVTATGSAGTLASGGAYSVIVVALTLEGWKNSTAPTAVSAGAVATQKTITGNDGNSYTLNGGSSMKSANTLVSVSTNNTLFASVTPMAGAFAYAWFVGTAAGSETLQAITTINSVAVTSLVSPSGNQTAASVTADCSANPNLAFDGLMTIGSKTFPLPASTGLSAVNPVYTALPTGTSGTGTFLTPSGRGSIIEIDNLLVNMWNTYRITPTVMFVNAQEQRNITNKCLTSASGPLIRYNEAVDASGARGIVASGVVRWYYNPFSVDGGMDIPIMVHPDIPPGTILLLAERLPSWYQNNEITNPFEVLTRRDYYRIDWPLRTRRREYGVYCEEVLGYYAPFALSILTNIGNG